jgi:predicted nuclease of restriction endonuclease-like (RecB) superfamily
MELDRFVAGQPAPYSTAGVIPWKDVIAKSFAGISRPVSGANLLMLDFSVAALPGYPDGPDIDNLCEPVLAVVVGQLGWFQRRRPNITHLVARKKIRDLAGCRIRAGVWDESWQQCSGHDLVKAECGLPLPENARDLGWAEWVESNMARKAKDGALLAVELLFPGPINLAEISTGAVKSVIDCLHPVLGGKVGAPNDHRITQLRVSKNIIGIAGSVLVHVVEISPMVNASIERGTPCAVEKPRSMSDKPTSTPAKRASDDELAFGEVVQMIRDARERTLSAVNSGLIELYWRLGESICQRIKTAGWGKQTVAALAAYIQQHHPNTQGFSAQNLWRMRQFFEEYRDQPVLSTLLRELPWSANLHIMAKCKRAEEREFYLRLATRERWSVREIARQIDGALFERAVLNPPQVSAALRESHPEATAVFRDAYLVEFLELPDSHLEADLHKSLLLNLRRFLAELGRDFCFIGSEVAVQVGGRDFALDLLFFHRGLSCLVAFELKIGEFQPEHLGKLNFYLEALDRDFRKPNEGPSIGVLLCASKNNEVVEYALSRTLSPALVAEYQTKLPDKRVLEAKLHEFYALNESGSSEQHKES